VLLNIGMILIHIQLTLVLLSVLRVHSEKKSFLGLPEVFRGLNVLFVTFCLSVYVCLLFMLDIFRVLF